MRKTCWIFIGDGNVKKSSAARGLLTAARTESCAEVETKTGLRFRIKPNVSAYQEREYPIKAMLDELNGQAGSCSGSNQSPRLSQDRFYNALVILREDQVRCSDKTTWLPPGKDYVDALISDDWDIAAIVWLGPYETDAADLRLPAWIRDSGIPYAYISDAKELPGTAVAAQVRELFGWR
jgi:hypothetical protein